MAGGRRLAVLTLAAFMVAGSVFADGVAPDAAASEVYPMVFPVDGPNRYSDTWGAPRSGGRTHEGTDIIADKMTPILAVSDGTIGWMHAEIGGNCCAMAIEHDDGWASWYIHLNNDTPGTDDGQGWGFAEGIERGVHVTAGQVVAYMGDSGNAESTTPHLHFELHQPDGTKINPYPHLVYAEANPPSGPEPGVVMFDPDTGDWHRRDSEGTVTSFSFGHEGTHAVIGDWDCDGLETPATYDPRTGAVLLSNDADGSAAIEYFVAEGRISLAGDFDGDGCDSVSFYEQERGRVFVYNALGGPGEFLEAEYDYYFGIPGDKPFVGDFDGSGIDTVGLHRESNGFVYMRHSHTLGFADNEFWYGIGGDRLIADDWIDQGMDTVAIFRPAESRLYFRFSNDLGFADTSYEFGETAWIPVAGLAH